MSIRLSKEEAQKKLDERKEAIKKVCLTKNSMSELTSRVALVLDTSGSMTPAFRSGMVQAVIERILPLAMAFDDNGEMEFWTFSYSFQRHEPITRSNFYTYLKDNGISAAGGTNYEPVMMDAARYFILEEPENMPNYIIYITDGDNFDPQQTDKAIKAISNFPIFFQFVGIGDPKGFKYLEGLDDMEGRYVDNANFFAINSLEEMDRLTDNELYTKLLDEYPKWLQYPQVRELIAGGKSFCHDKKARKKLEPAENKVWEITKKILKIAVDILID
ncbi:MAG: VWA domain-containing protein [Ruminococcus sp.]|nr:VWA domain-containing protein [Ruminococcus sp.]